jgi:hypothetical protein
MKMMRRTCLAGLLMAFAVFGQVASPPDIINQINSGRDVGSLWTSLGIAASGRFKCERYECQAESIENELDLELGGETAIVRVTYLFFSRFLIFNCKLPGCSFIDHIDRMVRYVPLPTATVQAARNKRWLVITGNTGGGSGIMSSGSEWYELRADKLHQILAVPDRGYSAESDPATTMFTRFVRYAQGANDESLEFAYHVEFGGGRPRKPPSEWGPGFLWDDEWTLIYSRSTHDDGYTLDRRRSTIPANWTSDDLIYGPGPNKILPYAADLLLKIARDPKDPRYRWLKQWIETAGESPEAQEIRAALKASER